MLDAGEYSSSSSAEYLMSCLDNASTSCSISKRKKAKNKRRFSDVQIKSLETIFDTETKLEPKKKLQLARDLGLQPRQVAIWFQNKRARWKSKQLERDYSLLKSNYDSLAFQFDSLKKERQTLLEQLRKLNDVIEKSEAQEARYEGCRHEASDHGPGDSIGCGLVNDADMMIKSSRSTGDQFEVRKTSPFLDSERTEYGTFKAVLSDDESSRNQGGCLGLEEEAPAELPLNLLEAANSSNLTEPEEWGTLESDGLLDQPGNGSKRWDFWS